MSAILFIFRLIVSVFFRDVEIVGIEKVPKKGPVIFAGNHPNGLIDALVLLAVCPRTVHFMAKDTLFKLPVIGWLVRGSGAVPVKRVQDHQGSKVDNSGAFDAVFAVLNRGGCFGIFPEGISHDKSELQDLKSGIARIALGVTEKHPETNVKIVPCGLTYIRGDKFRSQVLVEFGDPIEIEEKEVETFKVDYNSAVKPLMQRIKTALKGVTLNAPDWPTLRVMSLCKDLYIPKGLNLSLGDRTELTRRFSETYQRCAENEDFRRIREKLDSYQEDLDTIHVTDTQILHDRFTFFDKTWRLFAPLFFVLILVPLSVPGLILNFPIWASAKFFAMKLRKKHETDVIATYKVLIAFVLVPVLYTAYTILGGIYLHKVLGFHGLMWAAIIFFGLPMFTGATIQVIEQEKSAWRLFACLFRMITFHGHTVLLKKRRENLRSIIQKAVETYAAPEHLENRVVPKTDEPDEPLFRARSVDSVESE